MRRRNNKDITDALAFYINRKGMVKKGIIVIMMTALAAGFSFGFKNGNYYNDLYRSSLYHFNTSLSTLLDTLKDIDLSTAKGMESILKQINQSRLQLKNIDLWLRYLEPVAYRRINGPLPVEFDWNHVPALSVVASVVAPWATAAFMLMMPR